MFTEMISLNLYQFLLKVKEIIWLVPSIVDREKDGDELFYVHWNDKFKLVSVPSNGEGNNLASTINSG